MNNEQTLINLGFIRYPEWDYKSSGAEHYRLDKEGKTFRAYVNRVCGPPVFIEFGEVVNEKGHCTFRDCVSEGSVQRKLDELLRRS